MNKRTKKITAVILCCIMAFGCIACGQSGSSQPSESPDPVVTPVPSPTPTPEPPTEPGSIRLLSLPLVWAVLNRGDTVSITGEDDVYYSINYEGRELLVLKNRIRLSSEEIPEERAAYAASNALIFSSGSLKGEPVANPSLNEELAVLDEFNGVAFVRFGELTGYMDSSAINDSPVSTWNSWGGGGGAAGGGGIDGGDIALAYVIRHAEAVSVASYSTELKGTVFSDGTQAYCGFLKLGDKVKVADKQEENYIILYDDSLISVPEFAIRLDSDSPFVPFEGFAKSKTKLYSEYDLSDEPISITLNTPLTVIDEFEEVYLVSCNENTGYIAKDSYSETEITSPWSSWSGDGGGGSAPSGGGGGGEWTEPVM